MLVRREAQAYRCYYSAVIVLVNPDILQKYTEKVFFVTCAKKIVLLLQTHLNLVLMMPFLHESCKYN